MKMSHWKAAPLLLAIAALALPAAGQSVPPGDRTLENAFGTPGFQFLYGPVPNIQPQLADFNLQTINGFGPGYVYDFCADFFTGDEDAATFGVTEGFGVISSKEAQVRALFTNALPVFNTMLDDYIALNGGDWAENAAFAAEFDDLQAYGAGMQIALWEIIHEQTAELSQLSINDEGAFPGSFRVDVSAPSNTRADLGEDFAEQFLTSIRTGTWTNQGGVNFYYAEGGDDQDRLWMVVPEPSSALLGGIGLLALLRRRRA